MCTFVVYDFNICHLENVIALRITLLGWPCCSGLARLGSYDYKLSVRLSPTVKSDLSQNMHDRFFLFTGHICTAAWKKKN